MEKLADNKEVSIKKMSIAITEEDYLKLKVMALQKKVSLGVLIHELIVEHETQHGPVSFN
ncbi:MAG: hypothetical protein J6O13_11210 [Selenomonas sp.]|nr:hypothetical protein [Selenomonas sp.]